MAELWRTSLERIQKRFQDAVDQGCRLKCYLIQSAVSRSSQPSATLPDERQSPVAYGAGASCAGRQGVNAGGRQVAQEPGFSRRHRFYSEGRDSFAEYEAIANDAGTVVQGFPIRIQQDLWKQLPAGSVLSNSPNGVWTDAVFELAWQHVAGAQLLANKFAWSDNLAVDLEAIESFLSGASQVPPEIKSPPDHWYSRIDDLFTGSVAAIDILLSIQDTARDDLPTTAERDAAERNDWDWLIAEVCSPAKSIGDAVAPFHDDPDKAGAALIGCMLQRTRLSKGLDRAGVEIDRMPKEIVGAVRELGHIVWAAQRMVGFHDAAVHFAKSDLRGHAQRAWETVLRWKKQGGPLAWAAPDAKPTSQRPSEPSESAPNVKGPSPARPKESTGLATQQELLEWIELKRAELQPIEDQPIGSSGIVHLPVARSKDDPGEPTVAARLHPPSLSYVCLTELHGHIDRLCNVDLAVEFSRTFPDAALKKVRDLLLAIRWLEDRLRTSRPAGSAHNPTSPNTPYLPESEQLYSPPDKPHPYSPNLVGNDIADPTAPMAVAEIAIYIFGAPARGDAAETKRRQVRDWMQKGKLPSNGSKQAYVVSKSALETLRTIYFSE